MRRSRAKIVAAAWASVSVASAAFAAGGSLAGEVFSRPKSDRSSTSIGVAISEEELSKLPSSGRGFDEILFSVPGVQRSEVSAGHLPPDWRFDASTQSASGPAISSGHFRLDVPIGWTPRKKLQIELRWDGRSIWKDRVDVEIRDPLQVSHDATRYLDLPQTLHAGSALELPDGSRNKWGTDVRWDLSYEGAYRLPAGVSDRDWTYDDKKIFSSNFYLTGLASYVGGGFQLVPFENGLPAPGPRTQTEWKSAWPDRVGFFSPPPGSTGARRDTYTSENLFGAEDVVRPRTGSIGAESLVVPSWSHFHDRSAFSLPDDLGDPSIRLGAPRLIFGIRGVDPYGETLVQDYWNPVLLPPLWPASRPSFTGITEVVAPHESFCVTGQVERLDQWNDLQIGGRSLGAPIFATDSSAIYLPPADLDPGVHQLSFVPREEAGGFDTGLESAYITVSARIQKMKIKTGGQTQLSLQILGTERSFPVKLVNQSPEIINLEGRLEHHDMTTGGADNRIEKTILGLTPGNYDIYYEVLLPTCPGEGGDLKAADAGDAFAQALADWSSSLSGKPATAGTTSGVTVPSDASNPGFTLGGPQIGNKLWYFGSWPAEGPPREQLEFCEPSANQLTLNNDRFRVRVDFRDFAPSNGGACVQPRTDDTGLFYFSDPENWELLVKVLDGCSFNDHFWVFSAASTKVEYEMTVTDTRTGTVKTYFHPLGKAPPAVTDTAAFATCP